MKGSILHINGAELLIRAEDGNKYSADVASLKSQTQPQVGDPLDFELHDDKAVEIYILRNESQLESITKNAKESASAAFNKIRSQMNENNTEKAKELGKQATEKASRLIADIRSNGISVSSINASRLHNKFCFFSLLALLIATFLPSIDNENFYQIGGSFFVPIFIVPAMAVAYLGLKTIFYRVVTGLVLLIILAPALYGLPDFISAMNELIDMANRYDRSGDTSFKIIFELIKAYFLLGVTTILVGISLTPSFYREAQPNDTQNKPEPTTEA